ncbi:MAG: hypothetical protein HZB87_01590, partial [Desulfatitalea sp.]|nr:hypothetical protein [Desulfatitalea sp.]
MQIDYKKLLDNFRDWACFTDTDRKVAWAVGLDGFKACRILRAAIMLLICVGATLMPVSGEAKIYKYQRNGVWYYTDTP